MAGRTGAGGKAGISLVLHLSNNNISQVTNKQIITLILVSIQLSIQLPMEKINEILMTVSLFKYKIQTTNESHTISGRSHIN